jgi:hypothetical protein
MAAVVRLETKTSPRSTLKTRSAFRGPRRAAEFQVQAILTYNMLYPMKWRRLNTQNIYDDIGCLKRENARKAVPTFQRKAYHEFEATSECAGSFFFVIALYEFVAFF